MIIPSSVKSLFEKQALVALGTADETGKPNVNVVFWKKIFDPETILLVDNFMKRTKANILVNNQVCLSFWDSNTEEGYKLKGLATYYTEGPIFAAGKNFLQAKDPNRMPKGVIVIKVMEIYTITPGPEAGKKLEL